jgi:hypothetical protein
MRSRYTSNGTEVKYRFITSAVVLVVLCGAAVTKAVSALRVLRLNQELVEAVDLSKTARVSELLDEGADPNTRWPYGDAVTFVERLKRIVGRGHYDRRGDATVLCRYLTMAAFYTDDLKENVPMARVLLLHGADVNAVDKDGDSLFWLATCCDYQYTMRLLLRHGANVNSRNSRGMTALLRMTMGEEPIRMKILIEGGADPNIPDSDGDTCLAYAKYVGGPLGGRMVKLLTAAGARR